ncbi:fibronectin type III domain-containing protein, partial [bacterium]|nr:fibronectin type III domain-containing protein [bacterium]
MKEINGAPVTFEQIGVAILCPDGSQFDFATKYDNVTISANNTWSQSLTGKIYSTKPPGNYKAVIRGKVAGGNWFDFRTTDSVVNPQSFTVVQPTIIVNSPVEGDLIKSPNASTIYLIKNGRKWPILNESVFHAMCWDLANVKEFSEDILNRYPTASIVGGEGSLLKNSSASTVYLIENGKKRPFFSWDAFVKNGYKQEDIFDEATANILGLYPDGETIPLSVYSVPFDLGVDAYRFENFSTISLKSDVEFILMETKIYAYQYNLLLPELVKKMREGINPSGQCYGISATSILYKENPNLKPQSYRNTATYDMMLKDNEVTENIGKYQRSLYPQLFVYRMGSITPQYYLDPSYIENAYKKVENSIKDEKKPIMLLMNYSTEKGPGGHSVVAYKIIDYGDKKEVYIYDPNKPYPQNDDTLTKVVFDLKNGRFIGSKYWENDARYNCTHNSVIPYHPTPYDPAYLVSDEFTKCLVSILDSIYKDCGWIGQKAKKILYQVFCPVNVLITDQEGRKVGYINSQIINEIPGAEVEIIDDMKIFHVPAEFIYTVQITGTETGSFDFNAVVAKPDNSSEIVRYKDVPINTNTNATVNINPTAPDYTMSLSNNADGTVYGTRTPDFQKTLDTTPPISISDLKYFIQSDLVVLDWTAPTDNGTTTLYEVRYATFTITEDNWNSATIAGTMTPKSAGSTETFTIANLQPNTTYYFAVKTKDDAGLWSGLSNIVSVTTTLPSVQYGSLIITS